MAHHNDGLTAAELGRKYPIEVVDADPAWPARFRAEAILVRELLGPDLGRRIEHVGSTAVPGLAAKPVIDVLVEVPSFERAERDAYPALEQAGYACMWTTSASPGHLMCVKGYGLHGYVDGVQLVHLHLAPADHSLWERLDFRDYLRAHPDEAARYQELKRELALRHHYDREAYTAGKSALIRELIERARHA